MHKTRSSAGFSLDIPLIMLTASILKYVNPSVRLQPMRDSDHLRRIFYWIGARYDASLLLQAVLMVGVQVVLLHVALTHRPNATISHRPFEGVLPEYQPFPRPYDFWQWRPHRPYWQFIGAFSLTLLALQATLGSFKRYSDLLGYIGLAIEAVLPVPQILNNYRRRSCSGFRLSVLATWLAGDTTKLSFFFLSSNKSVPLAFRACALFQSGCDAYLGVQYLMYGAGPSGDPDAKAVNGALTTIREADGDAVRPGKNSMEGRP